MRSVSKILVVLGLAAIVGLGATANAALLLTNANQTAGDLRLSNGYATPPGLDSSTSTIPGTDWGDGITGAVVTTQFGDRISGTWNLGASTPLNTLSVYYFSVASNATSPINVYLSNDGTFGGTPDVSVVPADFGTWSATWNTSMPYYKTWLENIDLSGYSAQYIKVDMMNSQTGGVWGNWMGITEVGLSEGVIPEPSTLVLLAAALAGLLAYAWRKRK